MRTALATLSLASAALAHSGVWNIVVDGVNYPARDVRMDPKLGAKRVEWSFSDSMGIAWGPVENVDSVGIACGDKPAPPALKAYARAGANVTVEWSGIVRTHYGPAITYLAALPSNASTPSSLSFFKIHERGYDAAAKQWGNEQLIALDRRDTFQLPSDIAPGEYVLRTELISLHYATRTGAQFYPHCFNVQIAGNGTAAPAGVKLPGAYTKKDPSLAFALYKDDGSQNDWEHYAVPGPAKYAGRYDAPTGMAAVVSEKDRGVFPPEFQGKYDALKKKMDDEGIAFNDALNAGQNETGHDKVSKENEAKLRPVFAKHIQDQRVLSQELQKLRAEAIELGVAV